MALKPHEEVAAILRKDIARLQARLAHPGTDPVLLDPLRAQLVIQVKALVRAESFK